MNSRISTEYVSIESGRDHELLIVIFQKFYKFPYSQSYIIWTPLWTKCASAADHLVQYFCQCERVFRLGYKCLICWIVRLAAMWNIYRVTRANVKIMNY